MIRPPITVCECGREFPTFAEYRLHVLEHGFVAVQSAMTNHWRFVPYLERDPIADDRCPKSQRVDDPTAHSWRFDGDDPYIVCAYCDQVRDARTGKVIRG